MAIRNQQIHGLLVACRETRAEEIDCEEFLSRMAEYAEVRAAGRTVPPTLEPVAAHERLCASCAEECAALVEMVRAEPEADQ